MLDTGLTNNATVEVLRQAVLQLIQDHPAKFEEYIKFFEIACMYLQNETEETPEI